MPPSAAHPAVAPPPAGLAGTKRPYDEAGAPAVAGSYQGTAAGYATDAKRQHVAPPLTPASVPRETVYRLVLDVVDTALIIGRGGNTVRQIEQTTGGRVKRLQEPPGAREQVVVVWNSARELPSPGRMARNTAQEALVDCVRRVVFQENAPMGQPMSARLLISRTQEAGVMDNMNAIVAENPGISIELKRAQELPACALDNDVLVELSGEKYSLLAAVEALSHVLREHPILERPGGAPPALRALAGPPAAAPAGYGAPAPAYGGYRAY